MSDLDRELQAAYEAQQRQKVKLAESLDELRQTDAEGNRAGAMVSRAVFGVVGLVFLAISAVMLRDPEARAWYPVLLFCVIISGVWAYFRRQRDS